MRHGMLQRLPGWWFDPLCCAPRKETADWKRKAGLDAMNVASLTDQLKDHDEVGGSPFPRLLTMATHSYSAPQADGSLLSHACLPRTIHHKVAGACTGPGLGPGGGP